MKIALVNNNTSGVWRFRAELIQALVYNGHEVLVLSPPDDFVPKIEAIGAKHVPVALCRFPSISKDFLFYRSIYRIFKELKPDIVHTMTAKPNTFGVLAAKRAGVMRIVGLVAGAGSAFSEQNTLKKKALNWLVRVLYKKSIAKMDRLWFLNEGDKKQFLDLKLVPDEKAILIKSEGVNLRRYTPDYISIESLNKLKEEFKINGDTVCILMVGRMVWSKGVREFVETSKIAESWSQKTKFLLVGPEDANAADAVPHDYLKDRKNFIYTGSRQDVPELMQLSDIVALPSFYREGTPRVLLEAMAMHKPIVTTDNYGCRDTVDHEKTGFLVPVHDTVAFADAIKKLVRNKELRRQFGENAFEKVKNEFSVELVIERVLRELYQFEDFQLPDFVL